MSCPPFLDLPPGATAYRMETARGSFAVHDAPPVGPARGTALLVPGFTGSKEDFIALLGPLAEAGFRAVAVDQRGQYETGGPADEGAYAIEELARDVVALSEALACENLTAGSVTVEAVTGTAVTPGTPPAAVGAGSPPLHVLGHSFGGLVVRAAAVDHGPVPWASLTVLSSGPAALDTARAARVELLLEALPTLGMEAVWQAMRAMDEQLETPPVIPPEVHDFLRERWLANVPEHLMAAGKQLIAEPDRVAELAAVPVPKMVLSGSTDDAWPVSWMDEMAVRLDATRVVIEGSGHSPNTEAPQETARALISFWTGGDTGGADRGAPARTAPADAPRSRP